MAQSLTELATQLKAAHRAWLAATWPANGRRDELAANVAFNTWWRLREAFRDAVVAAGACQDELLAG